jgi:hypothetical protein
VDYSERDFGADSKMPGVRGGVCGAGDRCRNFIADGQVPSNDAGVDVCGGARFYSGKTASEFDGTKKQAAMSIGFQQNNGDDGKLPFAPTKAGLATSRPIPG